MTESEHLAKMHPFLRERVVRVLAAWRAGAAPDETIKIVESVRPLSVQQSYFKAGKSRADGVTSFSNHQFSPSLACDCIVIRSGKIVAKLSDPAWQAYGDLVEAEGLTWGGKWKLGDGPHCELSEVERIKLVQAAVGAVADGAWGPATAKAVGARVPLRVGRSGWSSLTPASWEMLLGGA